MTELSRAAALRIALAVRQLPGVTIPQLLEAINTSIRTVVDENSLKAITVSQLSDGLASYALPRSVIKEAVRILWGEGEVGQIPALETAFRNEPGVIRVAVASNQAEILDGHFGSCLRFLIYELQGMQVRLVDIRSMLESDLAEDKNAYRADMLRDCQILYVVSIGGPAAAKVVRAGVYPVKVKAVQSARAAMEKLSALMVNSPPPWLAKHMGRGAEERVRFERNSEEV